MNSCSDNMKLYPNTSGAFTALWGNCRGLSTQGGLIAGGIALRQEMAEIRSQSDHSQSSIKHAK